MRVDKSVSVTVGKLGSFDLPAGRYVYSGSAKRNIAARLARHLSPTKKVKWHIDYLLAHPEVKIIGIRLSEEDECEINQNTPGRVIVPGFGATDCRKSCGSHLKYLGL